MGKKEKGLANNNHYHAQHSANGSRTGSQLLLFARTFVKYPNMVGWMLPSSPWVVNDVLEEVDWKHAKVIVEYGPGVGTFTTKLLERMRSDATLVALEINPEFSKFLKKQIQDSRLRLVEKSATEVASVLAELGFAHADCVISGIPFKTIPHPLRDEIVRRTHSVLRPQGRFLVYQLSSVVLPYLEDVFGAVEKDFQLLSFVPARMFYCDR
jgi:phospholipid N-methyltransferase